MIQKERIDILMFEKGIAESREKAKSILMSGQVYVNNMKIDKPGTKINIDSVIEVRGNTLKYVSRGGLKLEKAVNNFNINLKDKACMDIGASTGGFTDCMLQNGASKVYSIDVGYGQLDWKLRQDERVINMERTNIRYVTLEDISEEVDFISVDVAFISLKLVLPVAKQLLKNNSSMVCLIKPQFEAGREQVGKKGVVRDYKVHKEVILKIIDFAVNLNFIVKDISYSPIKGPEGNIEYLLYIYKSQEKQPAFDDINKIDLLVKEANNIL